MGRFFGTDGVRGVANRELTPELAYRLGRAGAFVVTKGKHRPRIVVGKDTRISGDMLEAAMIAGILSVGADVLRAGVISTPGVAYLTRTLQTDAGVMISASHNPVEDNGIKFFGADGYKLSDEVELQIEALLEGEDTMPRPVGADIGRVEVQPEQELLHRYIDFLQASVPHRFDGLKIVLDCANGAASQIAPAAFVGLGATVIAMHHQPDGANINVNCGSTHPEELAARVVAEQADLGLAFDGDADRLIAVDSTGSLVDGDYILAILGRALKQQDRLAHDTVVCTVMSNVGFIKAAKENDIQLVRAAVGDRYVMEAMKEGGYVLGGEQSGHIIMLAYNTTGDGILTALQLVDTVVSSGQSLHSLRGIMRSYPQVMINVRVKSKDGWKENAAIQAAIHTVEQALGDDGRVLVRPSGTEPLIRVMAEGTDENLVHEYVEQIASVISRELGSQVTL